jgi:hypothetical protein
VHYAYVAASYRGEVCGSTFLEQTGTLCILQGVALSISGCEL